MQRAVIYTRVSSDQQLKNESLPTQRKACIEYCEYEGLEVARVFEERGESAKAADRTRLQELLAYCRNNRGQVQAVVVYSLSRFARNQYDHHALRALLRRLGITLRSVTEPIDDSPTGALMEGVLSSFAQFDNDVRAERTSAGLRAAKEKGRWPHPAPLGYLNRRDVTGAPTLVPDPERAGLVAEAFRLFAAGELNKRQVADRVNTLGLRTKKGKPLSPQTLGPLLKNPLYVGDVVDRKTGECFGGSFEPIVDRATFNLVQARLAHRSHQMTGYRRNHPEFPLRRFVRCGACGRPLTGSFTKGRSKKYPYYQCPSKTTSCIARVSTRKEELEKRFLQLLGRLCPDSDYTALFREIVLDAWRGRQAEARDLALRLDRRVRALLQQEEELVAAHVHSKSIGKETFQRLNDKLQEELALTRMELHQADLEEIDIDSVLDFAEEVLLDAARLWREFDLEQKLRFQQLLFPEGLVFDGEDFGTPVTSPIFSLFEEIKPVSEDLVARTGFEPVLPA